MTVICIGFPIVGRGDGWKSSICAGFVDQATSILLSQVVWFAKPVQIELFQPSPLPTMGNPIQITVILLVWGTINLLTWVYFDDNFATSCLLFNGKTFNDLCLFYDFMISCSTVLGIIKINPGFLDIYQLPDNFILVVHTGFTIFHFLMLCTNGD